MNEDKAWQEVLTSSLRADDNSTLINQSLISSARRLTYQWREEIYIVAGLLFAKNGEAPSKKLATVVAI